MRMRRDLTNQRFGRLVVLDYSHTDRRGNIHWRCLCDCGNELTVVGYSLTSGNTSSCGCYRRERRSDDLTGRRFGRLMVLGFDHMGVRGSQYWLCKCDCGKEHIAGRSNLLNGDTTSCGCRSMENKITHGMSGDRLYRIWRNMRTRCENEHDTNFDRYGARGIHVCDEWSTFENFRDWALDNGYDDELSIDRINNNDGYYPENCRWATLFTQCNNRRSNQYITYADTTHTIAEWSRILNINYHTLRRRIQKSDMRDFEKYYGE